MLKIADTCSIDELGEPIIHEGECKYFIICGMEMYIEQPIPLGAAQDIRDYLEAEGKSCEIVVMTIK